MRVIDTRKDGTTAMVRRRRVCALNHTIDTVEQPVNVELSALHVSSGSLRGGLTPWNRGILQANVRQAVHKLLRDVEVASVVDDVETELKRNVTDLARAPEPWEQPTAGPRVAGVVEDTKIVQLVERHLRRSGNHAAHVLYTLYEFGRTDRSSRQGFEGAADFLRWLNQEYSDIAEAVPTAQDRPLDRWFLGGRPPNPSWVIKRADDDRPRRAFAHERLTRSLEIAVEGRPDATRRVPQIRDQVLWAVAGQDTVSTGQLSAGILYRLRQVDDIAYLRWVIIMKRHRAVREIAKEAQKLLTDPSPRLEYRNLPSPEEARQLLQSAGLQ